VQKHRSDDWAVDNQVFEMKIAVRMQKSRGRFPGAGFLNFYDDEDMLVICPTCLFLAP